MIISLCESTVKCVCVYTERLISFSILYNKKEKKNRERNIGLPSNPFFASMLESSKQTLP